MMMKTPPPASPEAYVKGLVGWRQKLVVLLRSVARKTGELDERVKWGHLVYFVDGPALLIRAEEERVLFGFWRGKRLLAIEPRLKPGGKYEMATLELREGMNIARATASRLVGEAIALNRALGNPAQVARPRAKKKPARRTKKAAPRS